MRRAVISLYESHNPKTRPWTDAFAEGAERHGARVERHRYRPAEVGGADLHVFWGLRTQEVIDYCVANGQPFACLDHGYTPDRMEFASVNLNDLNGKSELDVSDLEGDGSRCALHGWGFRPRPAREAGGPAYVIGQIYRDKSLEGNDVYAWAARKVAELDAAGWTGRILFKPHPMEKPEAELRYLTVPAPMADGPMEFALAGAAEVHTFSSTAGVEAWLAGVPATAASPMSMIYREQFEAATPERRRRWLNGISYRQYSREEMRSGLAWEILGGRLLGRAPAGAPGRPCIYPGCSPETMEKPPREEPALEPA